MLQLTERAPEGTVEVPDTVPAPVRTIDELGEQICSLAASIAAATAQFLVLLKEYDERGGWKQWEMRSCAHWLSWRCAMDLRTAREHVRVARALDELPETRTEFLAGRLSFSKVRAISRVATPDNEPELVMLAEHATAAQVEKLCRGLRTASRSTRDADARELLRAEPDRTSDRFGIHWRYDRETGDLILSGRLSADEGAVLLAALTRAELERTRVDEGTVGVLGDVADGTTEHGEHGMTDAAAWSSAVQMLRTGAPSDAGPALVAMAMMTLTDLPAPSIAPAAEVLYVHSGDPGRCSAEHLRQQDDISTTRVYAGPALDARTADLVSCTAGTREVIRKDGAIMRFGRKRRRASPAQVKALLLRDDDACRAPGCGRRGFLHAHHVTHWAHGGPTDLDNLILLCSACHTSAHTGRLVVIARGRQRFEFRHPDTGAVIPAVPPIPGRADDLLYGKQFSPKTITGQWDGTKLNLSETTAGLFMTWAGRQRRAAEAA